MTVCWQNVLITDRVNGEGIAIGSVGPLFVRLFLLILLNRLTFELDFCFCIFSLHDHSLHFKMLIMLAADYFEDAFSFG